MNVAFKALVGSHNYNLNNENSDKDYKVFYYPTFDDMYNGDKTSKHKTSTDMDIEYHDIRKLPDMLWKSNVNFIEVLFSQEVVAKDKLYSELHKIREDIASMNLPYLWDACYGMMYQKLREVKREMEYTDTNSAKVSKSLYQARRIYRFLYSYADSEFTNFADSIYIKKQSTRDYILSVKSGGHSYEEEYSFLEGWLNSKDMTKIKSMYKSMERQEHVSEKVKGIVKGYVMREIAIELFDE